MFHHFNVTHRHTFARIHVTGLTLIHPDWHLLGKESSFEKPPPSPSFKQNRGNSSFEKPPPDPSLRQSRGKYSFEKPRPVTHASAWKLFSWKAAVGSITSSNPSFEKLPPDPSIRQTRASSDLLRIDVHKKRIHDHQRNANVTWETQHASHMHDERKENENINWSRNVQNSKRT